MATEVGRIVARYIADTTSFDAGNARVKAGMAATDAQARRGRGLTTWAQGGKYGILGVGAAVLGSLKSFANFDRNINILSANLDGLTNVQMKNARKAATDLGADMRFPAVTASHVADAMVELSKAGLNYKETMDAIEPTMLLGTAGQMEFADAAAIAANAMNAFGLQGKGNVLKVVDDIAGAALKSSSNVEDIAEAFRYASTSAAGLGVPIAQVTALTGLLSNLGLKGDMAGTSMRMFFTSIAKPRSAKAANLMKDLGLMRGGKSMFFDKKGEIKNLDEIAALWKKAVSGRSKQFKVGAAHTIFGVRGMNVARILEQGGPAFGKFQKESTKAGSANRLAAANTKGLYGAYQRLVNVVQTVGLQLGQELAPAAIKVLNALSRVAGIIQRNEDLVRAIARAIITVTAAWIAWKGALLAGAIALRVVRLAMIAYRTMMVAIYAPTLLATMSMNALKVAIMSNPIGILIAAIIVAVMVLRHFGVGIDDVRRIMTRAWHWIVRAWAGIRKAFMVGVHAVLGFLRANWPYVVGALLGPLGLAVAAIYKNWGAIKRFFGTVKDAIVNAIRGAFRTVLSFVTGTAGGILGAMKSLGRRMISAVVEGVKSAPGAIVDAIASQIPGGKKAKGFLGRAVAAIPRAAGGPIHPGTAYMVGERGPELFVSGQSGRIVPNKSLRGGGPSVTVENLNVRSEDDIYSLASVLGRRINFA